MRTAVDALPLIFSVLAVGISAASYRDRRTQDRRDLFLKLHERLVDPDIQMGRRLLHERVSTVDDAQRLRVGSVEDYQLINRALAMFDIFAMYVHRGYIDRDLALEEWGHSFARTYKRALPFIDDRAQSQTWSPSPHLRRFGPAAVAWHVNNSTDA
jgi:hypothetical protein